MAGHCDTSYKVVESDQSGVTVRRTKDLMACTGRNSHASSIQATSYSSTSARQTLPLLK